MPELKTNLQQGFIQILETLCPPNISLADTLADLLDISKDSAYRRIRCETIIDLNELFLISRHFNISIDNILSFQSNGVVFNYGQIKSTDDYKTYLQSIIEPLQMLSKHEDVRVIYAAQDIPLFHNFRFQKLAKFKLFYWLRSIVNTPELQEQQFNEDIIDDELIALGQNLYNAYSRVFSEEIWTEITPVSLFKQIEFCWSSGLFISKEQALEICDEVEQEFNQLEQQAKSGIKVDSDGKQVGFKKNFNLFLSEIEIGNNCIYTEVAGNMTVYLAYNTFNKITTTNQAFCSEIQQWLTNLITKSTPISEVSEKHRYQFFKKLHKGIEEIRNRIAADI
jgi:hypothetical protein